MKKPQKNLVLVEWEDAFGPGVAWRSVGEVKKDTISMMFAVGYLLAATEDQLTIVPYGDCDPETAGAMLCGEMVIPRSQVHRMWSLKIGRELKS